jgi:hypothetical protein
MKLSIRVPANFVSGLLFALIGVGAVVLAQNYPLGTLARMGPGMLPTILGVMLGVVGVALTFQSFVIGDPEESEARVPGVAAFRAALFLLLGLLAFALLIRPAGLFIAIIALVLLATRAEPGYPILSAVMLAVAMAVLSTGIFVYALGLPFRIWP